MLRVVLAVLLAVALLGVAEPAVETARVERSAASVEGDLAAVETAARDLTTTADPATELDVAARRTVTVEVPDGSPTTAPVSFVAIGGLPDGSTASPPEQTDSAVLAYHVDGATHVRRVPFAIRTLGPDGGLRPPGEPLVLRETRQITLLLLERDGDLVLAVTTGEPDVG